MNTDDIDTFEHWDMKCARCGHARRHHTSAGGTCCSARQMPEGSGVRVPLGRHCGCYDPSGSFVEPVEVLNHE